MVQISVRCWKCNNETTYEYTPAPVPIVKGQAADDVAIIIRNCPICENDNLIKISKTKLNSSDPIKVGGEKVTGSDNKWIEIGGDYVKTTPDTLNVIAKDLVALNSALITAYIAALTFLKIPKTGILSSSSSWVWVALPIVAWLGGIAFSAIANLVKIDDFDPGDISSIKGGFKKIVSHKSWLVTAGYGFLILGLLLGAIFIGGANYRTNTLSDVQFIIGEEQIPVFENMSMIEDDQTLITVPVTLIGESETAYTIRKDNGEIIVFNKDQVVGVKYRE